MWKKNVDSLAKHEMPGPGAYEVNDNGFVDAQEGNRFTFKREPRVFDRVTLEEQRQRVELLRLKRSKIMASNIQKNRSPTRCK